MRKNCEASVWLTLSDTWRLSPLLCCRLTPTRTTDLIPRVPVETSALIPFHSCTLHSTGQSRMALEKLSSSVKCYSLFLLCPLAFDARSLTQAPFWFVFTNQFNHQSLSIHAFGTSGYSENAYDQCEDTLWLSYWGKQRCKIVFLCLQSALPNRRHLVEISRKILSKNHVHGLVALILCSLYHHWFNLLFISPKWRKSIKGRHISLLFHSDNKVWIGLCIGVGISSA